MNTLTHKPQPPLRRDFLWALTLGTLAFFWILGPSVLNPLNVSWLNGGDPLQNYLGWAFYKNSAWTVPLGLNPSYGLELSNSIVYTDSNPLFAMVFKALSPLLPSTFQYVGIWLLCCFILQAFFSLKLLGLVSNDQRVLILGSLFFLFAPPFMWRAQAHFNLVGHFIVLAGLYLVLRPVPRRQSIAWVALFAIATLTHAYFLPMLAALWLGDLTWKFYKKDLPAFASAIELVAVAATVIFCAWQAGYFAVSNGGASATGYGVYRFNLLSLIDPVNSWDPGPMARWSYVLRDIPEGSGDYEGFNYLGLGTLLLLLFALPGYCNSDVKLTSPIKRYPFFFVMLLALALFAITPRIGFGAFEWTLPLNDKLERLANIFRASGRLFWPVYYVVVLAILYLLLKTTRTRVAVGFLALAAFIQIVDTGNFREGFQARVRSDAALTVTTPLKAPFWEMAAHRYKKVRATLPTNQGRDWSTFSKYAASYGLATDMVYLARMDQKALAEAGQEANERIAKGDYAADTLYVVDSSQLETVKQHLKPQDLLTAVDGFNVLAPGWNACQECLAVQGFEIPVTGARRFSEEAGTTLSFVKGQVTGSYLEHGWSSLEDWGVWSNGQAATLTFPATNQLRGVAFTMNAFLTSVTPVQRIGVSFNGIPVGVFQLSKASDNLLEIELPAAVRDSIAEQGSLTVQFDLKSAIVPRDLGLGSDDRMLAIGLKTIALY
ncbi:DUF6311 domain-containing protein [Pseudomonas sp. Snoq117.2]|uniref:DUF6311 domain-containing protein n=1 Tax=Pseudomonas sp. Snoq117.2 TaxID=1500302 RepID=UPI0008BD0E13|nr:DUF6311 domain-containing protein [Pseudomonas sp. Snoq117.2]SEP34672.1 hypothetical protein SAMN02787149_106277 [Pseudomonas sp. Snoq117.2]